MYQFILPLHNDIGAKHSELGGGGVLLAGTRNQAQRIADKRTRRPPLLVGGYHAAPDGGRMLVSRAGEPAWGEGKAPPSGRLPDPACALQKNGPAEAGPPERIKL